MRFRERLTAYQRRRKMTPLIATIHDQGDLMLGEDQRLCPKEALRLARWILDTFEDKP